MKSKTKIDKQLQRKTNPELVETILKAKKKEGWLKIADTLSRPRKRKAGVNLDTINKQTKEGDTVVVPGKVLGVGNISKKIRVAALGFSESAKEKLKAKKGEIVSIQEEIKANPKAQGIKIIIENEKQEENEKEK